MCLIKETNNNPKLITMKTLKTTLLLAAVFVLTMSGTSSDQVMDNELQIKQNNSKNLNLLVHDRKSTKLPSQSSVLM